MYVFEIYAEGIFVTFPWWLENVKSRSKIAPFSNERHFEIWFPKREQLRISEVNYLNYIKKDPILHVATTFSLKQGETRTSHGPIPHSLTNISFAVRLLRSQQYNNKSKKPLHICDTYNLNYVQHTTYIVSTYSISFPLPFLRDF